SRAAGQDGKRVGKASLKFRYETISAVTIQTAYFPDVAPEVAIANESGHGSLCHKRRVPVAQVFGSNQGRSQRLWRYHEADTKTWKEALRECADVDHCLGVHTLQRLQRSAFEAEFTVIIIFDDCSATRPSPFQQGHSTRIRHDDT